MKATDLIEGLKRREHRPAIFITVGVLVYLVFVSWPPVLRALFDVWQDVRSFGLEGNSFGTCLLGLASSVSALLCLLASIAIWVLSIFVSWAAFRKSRKGAFLFILAYFLIPLLLAPATWLTRQMFSKSEFYHDRITTSIPVLAQAGPPVPAVIYRRIEVPLGPFLLLAGLWYLYRNERTMNGEQIGSPGGLRLPAPPTHHRTYGSASGGSGQISGDAVNGSLRLP